VEASLPELFLDIDLALVLHGQQVVAHPDELFAAHPALCNIDRPPSQVGADDVAFGGGRVVVVPHEVVLVLHRAHRGTHD